MRILFGSVIVKGAGRLNGNVVRNYKGQAHLTRLALPRNKNTLKQVQQKAQIAKASNAYKSLTPEERSIIAEQATYVPFTNQWGETYYKSGRNFYIYCSLYVQKISGYPLPLDPFDTTVPIMYCNKIEIWSLSETVVFYDMFVVGVQYVLIYGKKIKDEKQYFQEKELPYLGYAENVGFSNSSAYDILKAVYPDIGTGMTFAISIKMVTEWGLVSTSLTMPVVVQSS